MGTTCNRKFTVPSALEGLCFEATVGARYVALQAVQRLPQPTLEERAGRHSSWHRSVLRPACIQLRRAPCWCWEVRWSSRSPPGCRRSVSSYCPSPAREWRVAWLAIKCQAARATTSQWEASEVLQSPPLQHQVCRFRQNLCVREHDALHARQWDAAARVGWKVTSGQLVEVDTIMAKDVSSSVRYLQATGALWVFNDAPLQSLQSLALQGWRESRRVASTSSCLTQRLFCVCKETASVINGSRLEREGSTARRFSRRVAVWRPRQRYRKKHGSQLCRTSDNKPGVLQHVTFSCPFRQQPGGHVTALFGYRRLLGQLFKPTFQATSAIPLGREPLQKRSRSMACAAPVLPPVAAPRVADAWRWPPCKAG